MLAINQIIEGTIESIAFGGEGILRFQGFVVFVPFTAKGDRILCRITDSRSSFAKGELVELQYSSPDRSTPKCPYFGTCGGCQLQHLNPNAQLQYKLSAVEDTLQRIGHLSIPSCQMIPATKNWSYRRHITLQLKATKEGFEMGYIARDNHSLIDVRTCPIFHEVQDPILQETRKFLTKLQPGSHKGGRLTLLKNHRHQYILFFRFDHDWQWDEKLFTATLRELPLIAGILVHTAKGVKSYGDIYCEEMYNGLTFRFTPQTFIQNNAEQSAKIYQQICLFVNRSVQRHVLDLYCGFGMSSLLLAKEGHAVTGMEQNKQAILFAKQNAEYNKLNNLTFIAGDVEQQLPVWLKAHTASTIIINPPRQGLTQKVTETLLQKAQAESILYISCMPSTLARDLRALSAQYEVQEGLAYDMFPQTAHVETLVYLKRFR